MNREAFAGDEEETEGANEDDGAGLSRVVKCPDFHGWAGARWSGHASRLSLATGRADVGGSGHGGSAPAGQT